MNRLIGIFECNFEHDWQGPAHTHEFHEILVMTHGCMGFRLSGQEFTAREGSVHAVGARQEHQGWCIGKHPVGMLCLWFERTERPLQPLPLLTIDTAGHIRAAANRLYEIDRDRSIPAEIDKGLLASGLIEDILLEVLTVAVPAIDERLRHAKEYADRHFARPVALATLARIAAMSPFHFAREFKKSIGMSPMAYVTKKRIEAATGLLLTTADPLKQIARKAGFKSAVYFTSAFSKIKGFPPGELRKCHARCIGDTHE